MKRLTIRNSDGSVSQPTDLNWAAALEKLAAYEDTGMSPSECAEDAGFLEELKRSGLTFADVARFITDIGKIRLLVVTRNVGSNDCISREAAIDVFSENCDGCCGKGIFCDDCRTGTYKRNIRAIPAAAVQYAAWISVAERLPEIEEEHQSKVVLCALENGGFAFSPLVENIFGQLWFECERQAPDGEDGFTVTHWMPVPDPPKEENE